MNWWYFSDALTIVVSTPLEIKLSANCAAIFVTKIEASGGRIDTWDDQFKKSQLLVWKR